MEPRKDTITVPGDLAGVEQVRLFVKAFINRLFLPDELAYHLELAAIEACLNIIHYAYADRRGEIRLAAWPEAGRIYLEIKDTGRPFDPRQVEPPDLDRYMREGVKGGFGVFLMRRLMDGLDYRREEGQNVLTLWKTLPPSGASRTL